MNEGAPSDLGPVEGFNQSPAEVAQGMLQQGEPNAKLPPPHAGEHFALGKADISLADATAVHKEAANIGEEDATSTFYPTPHSRNIMSGKASGRLVNRTDIATARKRVDSYKPEEYRTEN